MFKPHSFLNLRRKIFLGSTSSFPQKPRTCLFLPFLNDLNNSEQVLRFEGIATFFFFWKGQWFLFQSFQARILHRHFRRFWDILCPNFYRLIMKTSMLDRCVLVFFLFFFSCFVWKDGAPLFTFDAKATGSGFSLSHSWHILWRCCDWPLPLANIFFLQTLTQH